MYSAGKCIYSDIPDESDYFDLPSLSERLGLGSKKDGKNYSPGRKVLPSHTISDSEESDCAEKISPVYVESTDLPDLCTLLPRTFEGPTANMKKPVMKLEITLSDSEEEFKGSLTDIPKRPRKISPKKVKDTDKDQEKERKLKLREEKQRQKDLAKAIRASEKELQKSKKPEECLKSMKIVVDHNLIFLDDAQTLFNVLDENNIKYSMEENALKFSIMWLRTVADVSVENNQVVKEERDEIENTMILMIPNNEFLQMLHSSVMRAKGKEVGKTTLLEYITNVKIMFTEVSITCVIVGFSKFMRDAKEKDDEMKRFAKQVSKTGSEEAIIEVQLQAFINFNFVDSMVDFGHLLHHFTKAIAEAPNRKEKQHQKDLAFSWFADADSSCPVRIAKDGSGLMKLWKQQMQQFQNVGSEIAEAIVSKYPSPQILMHAYKKCNNAKEAENLLQDIVVRRNYGPLGTQRRIGPELSYKIYLFFSSLDGNQILQR